MATDMLQYLDPDGLDETVLNIAQIKTSLEEEMQELPYALPNGIYPDMTVGAVIGADETAQWAQRVSTGNGAATVRSVQGATEVQNGALVPVRIAGIRSTDAQGGELDAIEWPTQTLRAAGSVCDELTADELVTRVGVVDLGTLTWKKYSSSGDVGYYFAVNIVDIKQGVAYLQPSNLECARYTVVAANWETNTGDKQISKGIGATDVVIVKDSTYTEAADFKAAMAGVMLYYELATPTTTPISPALPMTYKVERGGSESIIVPEGEVSAAPVLTVAEPVNMSTELARIWAAIKQLQSRGTAQLSRPVSLTDIGSIDEVQKDTTEIAEIETSKEVQE